MSGILNLRVLAPLRHKASSSLLSQWLEALLAVLKRLQSLASIVVTFFCKQRLQLQAL